METPEKIIAKHDLDLTGRSKKERTFRKREILKKWLLTVPGENYLRLIRENTQPLDPYNNMVRECAGLIDPNRQVSGEIVRSNRGTYGSRIKGNRAYSFTRQECLDRGLTPGPGNYC